MWEDSVTLTEMKYMRDFGLVHNDSDPDRYWRIVSYEYVSGSVAHVIPVRREYRILDVSDPKRFGYKGPEWRLTVVRVTELERMPVIDTWHAWPKSSESEELRRARIRYLRTTIHVNQAIGAQEPVWMEAANDNGLEDKVSTRRAANAA